MNKAKQILFMYIKRFILNLLYRLREFFGMNNHTLNVLCYHGIEEGGNFYSVKLKELEKNLGFRIDYFAYPKGIYNKKIIDAVKKAGYKGAFAVKEGSLSRKLLNNFNIWQMFIGGNAKYEYN